ncbi:MAG: hypothetical protein J1G30_08510 [Spirochaetales bacterium]|nr:hypothetical protein [Spirochaetales bacterium]
MKKSSIMLYTMFLCTTLFFGAPLYKSGTFTITDLNVYENTEKTSYRAWLEGDSLCSNYNGEVIRRKVNRVCEDLPELSTGYPMIDMLYALAMEEVRLDINEKNFFTAGAEWNQAWTRDMSYAIWLSLAASFNKVSIDSLKTRIFNGKIMQDTGTGGSYPCSSDRVVWLIAAYETALLANDPQFYKEVYEVGKNTLLQDLEVIYDKKRKLYRGEESFLDWREQTYPRWMRPADIAESFSSSTNVVHYAAWKTLEKMAVALGKNDEAAKWNDYAQQVKNGVNNELWCKERGYYSAYLIDGVFPEKYEGYDNLGNALSVLFGVCDGEKAISALNCCKAGEYGFPVVVPQLNRIQPYHNDAVWPFVQGYRALAAAKIKDEETFSYEFFTLIRSAALFTTFKENLVASTGDKKTLKNSDRQLWSIAAYLGMVYRGLVGIDFTENGIKLSPVVPQSFKARIRLNRFVYNDSLLNFEIQGTGADVKAIYLDGNKMPLDYIIPPSLKGEHTVTVVLSPDTKIVKSIPKYSANEIIKVVETAGFNDKGNLKWNGKEDSVYKVFCNGKLLGETKGTTFGISPDNSVCTEYWIGEAKDGLPILKGIPIWYEPAQAVIFAEAEKADFNGGRFSDKLRPKTAKPVSVKPGERFSRLSFNGSGYIEEWGKGSNDSIEFTLKKIKAGDYVLDVRYQNPGPINTGEKCALRELEINGEKIRIVYFPHTGNPREWDVTAGVSVNLKAGVNSVRLYNSQRTKSQKDVYVPINIDLLRLRKIR